MSRYQFDVSLHVRPASVARGNTVQLGAQSVETLSLPTTAALGSFEISFEEACDALAALPRMFVEPDGAIVWTGEDETGRWQLDGNLYDRAGRLLYATLAGVCPATEFDRLLATLGWPVTRIAFQLRRDGIWLDESVFRVWAAGCAQLKQTTG